METVAVRTVPWSAFAWTAFVVTALLAVLIAAGISMEPLLLLAGIVAILFAYHYPYVTFGFFIALTPLLGVTVSIPTGELEIGRRAFGGSIDIALVEAVAAVLIMTWAIKVLWLWVRRNDANWKPWFPLALPMAGIVGTHMLSAFSVFQPDALFVVKYAIRPVLWSYLIYVGLTTNFIRSRRILSMTLGVIAVTGIASALMGLASLGVAGDGPFLRARPLPLFGITPLGDNHNLLGEWLCFTIPVTVALILLHASRISQGVASAWKKRQAAMHRLLVASIWLQTIVALLTFSRTVWIVLALQGLAAAWFVWREQAEKWIRKALVGIVLLLPVAALMFTVSSTAEVASSTSTRFMLTEISLTLWRASPWVGLGAGTFVERVGSTQLFVIEHGAPLDSHGLGQKLLAETGLLGVAAFAIFTFAAFRFVVQTRWHLHGRSLQVFTLLAIAAGGALVYQLFNTNYWSGKLWLPIGIMLAAARALVSFKELHEYEP